MKFLSIAKAASPGAAVPPPSLKKRLRIFTPLPEEFARIKLRLITGKLYQKNPEVCLGHHTSGSVGDYISPHSFLSSP